jgi:hypothetical protein
MINFTNALPNRSSIVRVTGAVLVGAALFGMVACSQTLKMDTVKSAVSSGVTTQVGLTVASVTCPDTREVKANDTFECTVAPQGGGRLTVKVTQKDDQGNVNWEVVKTEGLLDLAALETQIKTGLKEQAAIDATVSCGGKFRATEPGKSFECTATDAQGAKAQVAVTMKDAEGNVSWSLGK